METEKLKQYCTVVEVGSLTQAALILRMPLSTLSKSIKQLQEELGFHLLMADGRGIQVTDLGKEVYKNALPILGAIQNLRSTHHSTSSSNPISIKVGGLEVFTHFLLGRLLHGAFPKALIELFELRAGDLERSLLTHKIDVGVTYFPQPQEGIEYLKVSSTQLKVFIRREAKILSLDSDTKFILPLSIDSPELTHILDKDGWPDLRIPRNQGLRTNRLSSALNLITHTNYALFIPQFIANEINTFLPPPQQLIEIKVPKVIQNIKRDIFLVKRKETPEGKLLKILAKGLRREAKA